MTLLALSLRFKNSVHSFHGLYSRCVHRLQISKKFEIFFSSGEKELSLVRNDFI